MGLLTLKDEISFERLKEFAIPTALRDLLRSFNKVKTLHVSRSGLIRGVGPPYAPRDSSMIKVGVLTNNVDIFGVFTGRCVYIFDATRRLQRFCSMRPPHEGANWLPNMSR